MTAALDPGRFKAICKRRHDWYIGTCLLMPLGFVGCIQQASSRPHGHPSPLILGFLLVGLAATVAGDLIWRCPACKGRLPRGFAPAPQYCPQCAIPLADPAKPAWAHSKEARRCALGLLGVLMVASVVSNLLAPPRRQVVTGRRGGAPNFTQPNVDDVAHLRRQLGEVDRLLAARYPGAVLHGSTADLALLQRLLDEYRRKPDQTLELQCLGVAFGNVLAREAGMHWITVLDDEGRDPALQYERTSLIVFPLTVISQRVDAGEPVDLRRLLGAFRALVKEHVLETYPVPAAAADGLGPGAHHPLRGYPADCLLPHLPRQLAAVARDPGPNKTAASCLPKAAASNRTPKGRNLPPSLAPSPDAG